MAHLEVLCKQFKLPHSALNKAVLIKCLTKFSQQKEKWPGYVVCYSLPAPLHILFQD